MQAGVSFGLGVGGRTFLSERFAGARANFYENNHFLLFTCPLLIPGNLF